jgi:hypothetical protein
VAKSYESLLSVVDNVPWELLVTWFENVSVFVKYHAVIDILYLLPWYDGGVFLSKARMKIRA